jgi:hypothetical protein
MQKQSKFPGILERKADVAMLKGWMDLVTTDPLLPVSPSSCVLGGGVCPACLIDVCKRSGWSLGALRQGFSPSFLSLFFPAYL